MMPPCHRARALVSQGLDGQLHELEERFVAAHLRRCDECEAFREDAVAFTALLRDAPLEPVPWPVTIQARVPRQRIHFRAIAQIASVASVVIAAGTIALAYEPVGTSESSAPSPLSGNSIAAGEESIRELRREALVRGELQVLPIGSSSPTPSPKPALPVEGK